MKNAMLTTISQQIISNMLLRVVIGRGKKSNFSGKFKLKPIITNQF